MAKAFQMGQQEKNGNKRFRNSITDQSGWWKTLTYVRATIGIKYAEIHDTNLWVST